MRKRTEKRKETRLKRLRAGNGGSGVKAGVCAALCVLLLTGCMVFAGCVGSAADPGNTGGEAKDFEAELYYVNEAYVEGGDEALSHFEPAVETTVKAEPGKEYMKTLEALAQIPEGDEYAGYGTMVKDPIKIDGAALEEDGRTVTVDFHSEGLSGGSTEETLLVEQIVWTLTESFDEVEQVRFTVGGAPAETLMGHMDASAPYGIMEVDNGEGEDVDMVMPLYD